MISRFAALLLPILLPGAAATAQSADGTASVRLLGRTSIVNTDDLDFGTIAVGPAGGAVVLAPAGRPPAEPRRTIGDVTLLPGPAHSAAYEVRGKANDQISVYVPEADVTLTLAGGAETLTLTDLATDPTLKGKKERLKLDKEGRAVLSLGGTLRIPGDAPGGTYQGSFDVTIDGY